MKMDGGMYLFETKTKGDINESLLHRQLSSGFDLQTMLYMASLHKLPDRLGYKFNNAVGVRYNVIRRPLSGGRGTIRVNKNETLEHFYQRLGGIIQNEPEYYFMRWKVNITAADIKRFCRECLEPILEQLCWWYDIQTTGRPSLLLPTTASNWRHPYGVFNTIDENGTSDLDEYLRNGSEVGLRKTDTLFPELSGGI